MWKNPGTVPSKCSGHYLPFSYWFSCPLPGSSSSMNTIFPDIEKSGLLLPFLSKTWGLLIPHNSILSFKSTQQLFFLYFFPTAVGIHCQTLFWICNQVIFFLPSLCYQILAYPYFTNGNFSASHFWYIYTFDPFPKRRSPSASVPSTSHFYKVLDRNLTITFLLSHSSVPTNHIYSFSLPASHLLWSGADFFMTSLGYDFLFFSL